MALTQAPICDFGWRAPGFVLPGVDGRTWSLEQCMGERGLVVMFICNHCPYVKAIQSQLVSDMRELALYGVGGVAIMSNDPADYPEDSFENMQKVAAEWQYPFPYLYDETQEIAKAYGAVCTPDFFGFNKDYQLQYRGRLNGSGRQPAPPGVRRELVEAMRQVAEIGKGPAEQAASIGCSIKWKQQ